MSFETNEQTSAGNSLLILDNPTTHVVSTILDPPEQPAHDCAYHPVKDRPAPLPSGIVIDKKTTLNESPSVADRERRKEIRSLHHLNPMDLNKPLVSAIASLSRTKLAKITRALKIMDGEIRGRQK